MTEYLRRENDRRESILNDRPGTKFFFESQRFPDIPRHERPSINNLTQLHAYGAKEVRDYNSLIEAAAERHSIDPDIVRAIIYTEASRGKIYGGNIVERIGLAKTRYPGNISPSWQDLIPGSDVKNENDNIELATMLISRIARRLDDPSIENIYSLYNSLSHDRTYVNKETKSTPYFAKLAMEAKAWEKDRWQPPELTEPAGAQGQHLRSDRQDSFNGRFGSWASSPSEAAPPLAPDSPNSFDDRFGAWGSAPPAGFGNPSSPVIRELLKYRKSALPDTSAASPWAKDLPSNSGSFDRYAGSNVPSFIESAAYDPHLSSQPAEETVGAIDRKPARYLARRVANQPDALIQATGAPAVPFDPAGEIRFHDGASQASRPLGIVSGKPMPNYPFPPPIWNLPNDCGGRSDDRDDRLAGLLRIAGTPKRI